MAGKGGGKSGGCRLMYLDLSHAEVTYLIYLFAKAFVQIPHRPPLLLASNGEFNPEDIEMFDARIPKGADIDEILQHRAKNPI